MFPKKQSTKMLQLNKQNLKQNKSKRWKDLKRNKRKNLKGQFKTLLKHIKKSKFHAAGKLSAEIMTSILGEVPAEWDEELVFETPYGPWGPVEKVPVDPYGVDVAAVTTAPAAYGAPYAVNPYGAVPNNMFVY